MKKSNWMPSIVLGSICIVVALLLSVVNMITGPIIEAAQNASANEALLEVLPDGKNFEEIEITSAYPTVVTAGYKADGGYVFQMNVIGKSSGLVIMCGVDTEGNVVGTKVIANEETPGYAAKVFPEVEGLDGKYKGMNLTGFDPYLVSGATLTSKAYGEAIKAALQAAVLAAGGEVDTRTPEQILQDNLNAALGTEGKTFEKWFATEILEGIDKTYKASDNSGFVFVIGETFIGVHASGVTTDGVSADNAAKATAAYTRISASSLKEITVLPANLKSNVRKVFVTESGNYVFELEGYGYYYEYGTAIEISVCISADGKIIDCMTTNQAKGEGFDKSATEEYGEQYVGKESADIIISVQNPSEDKTQIPADSTDIGAISGATFTTVGYQEAIKAAFDAFEKLTAEGGNK